jgi:mannose PTS system EIID component
MTGVPRSPTRLPGSRAMLLRSFAIQGSFNYRTLIGTGFAFALLPVLRHVYRARPAELADALRRHTSLFNSHPYLAGVALGGVARLEAEGERAEVIERFKNALRGSLGSLGDRLVWAGWRPVCLLAALLLLIGGAPWWLAAGAFLIVYNAGHFALRIWAFRLGLRHGLRVGERLRQSRLGPVQKTLPAVGAFLIGALVPLAATGEFVGVRPALPWVALALVGAAIGVRFGGAVRTPLALLLGGVAVLGMLMRTNA